VMWRRNEETDALLQHRAGTRRAGAARRLAGVGAVLVAAVACGGGSTGTSTASAPPAQLEKTTLNVNWSKFAGNDAGYRLAGFAQKYGLQINLVEAASGSDALTAIVSGQTDFGQCTYTYLFQGRDQGADMVAIANNATGGTAIVTSNKLNLGSGDYVALKTLAEQRAASGSKLKLLTNNVSINYALGYLTLQKHGIDVNSLFTIDNVLNFGLHPQQLASGGDDIAITGEPGATTIVAKKFGKFFANPYDSAGGSINTEWCALRSFVTKYPNTAKAAVKAIYDTENYLTAHPSEEAQDVVNFTGLDSAIAADALKNVHHPGKLDVTGCDALGQVLFDFKLVKNNYSGKCSSFVLTDLAK
jgi:ABC-type nitrate/sulfonate/bicarbonate transport system substrate-binding protein